MKDQTYRIEVRFDFRGSSLEAAEAKAMEAVELLGSSAEVTAIFDEEFDEVRGEYFQAVKELNERVTQVENEIHAREEASHAEITANLEARRPVYYMMRDRGTGRWYKYEELQEWLPLWTDKAAAQNYAKDYANIEMVPVEVFILVDKKA